MKKLIRNIAIMLIFCTGVPYFRYRMMQKRSPVVRVLVLHDITDKRAFSKFLTYIQQKYNVVSPSDFEEGNFSRTKLNILLTFDDGYDSWQKVGAPLLVEKDMGAYFFVSSGVLEASQNIETEKSYCRESLLISHRKLLTKDGLYRLSQTPDFHIGGHTITHQNLREVPEGQLFTEIADDKKNIEEIIKEPTNVFAYPFGQPGLHVSSNVVESVKNVGYTKAFTTEIAFTQPTGDQHQLARTNVDYRWPSILLAAWVYGSYDGLKKLYAY